VPEAGYTITTEPMGPGGCDVHTVMVHLGAQGHPELLVFETGKIGRQAAGAVTLAWGESVIYATASRNKDPRETIDFIPLSVK